MKIRLMEQGEEAQVARLARHVFHECVSESCTKRGIQKFKEDVVASTFRKRKKEGGIFFVAEAFGKIIGIIGIKNDEYVSVFFVDTKYQGMGAGSKLLRQAVKTCLKRKPDLSVMKVNSSLYAEDIYSRWGFRKTGPRRMKRGIRFVPMKLKLKRGR